MTLDDGGLLAAVRTTRPAEVSLQAWPTATPNVLQQGPWVATNGADVAKLAMPTAGTSEKAWSWRALVRDPLAPALPPVPDVTRSVPKRPAPGRPSAFTFAFGCCTVRTLGPAFDSVLKEHPQFLALIGDLGYPDRPSNLQINQDYPGYLKFFSSVMTQDRMRSVAASMPIFAVQDDHDYGIDDADRTTIEPFAAQAFADMIPGAVYPGRNYRQWSVGEAAFFLTDNRRWKDPEAGPFQNGRYMSVLGTRQRTWLLEGLAASTAKVNFVFIPMTMAWYWSRAEMQEVQTFITKNVTGAVVFLSGDKHAGAVARYSPRIWEFLASPMSNPTKHSTGLRTSAVIWTENGTGPALYNAYGLVDVDTLTTQTCTLRLIREDGVEMHSQSVPLA